MEIIQSNQALITKGKLQPGVVYMAMIPALGRLMKEDFYEFEN